MDEANEQPQWYKHPTDSLLEVRDGGAQPQGEMQEDKDIIEVLTARDNAEEWSGRLAVAISEHFRVPVGEHSSCNDPRQIALEILSGGYKTDSDADRELAALRRNAGDYKEALAEIERLRGALKEARRKAWQDDFRPIINAIGEISVQEAMDAIERTL